MSDLWQITFLLPDASDEIAEMMQAAIDAESISIHHDDDRDPWLVTLITTIEPEEAHVNLSLANACKIMGQPVATADITLLPSCDWLSENRKSFPPLDIGPFWIHGSHISDPVPSGKIALKINANQAFGSGTHATTYGCIMMLEKYCPERPLLKIADIGCGSAILAMAAAKIRPDAEIIAVDNDLRAVETARENATDNGVDDIIRVDFSDGYNADIIQDNAPYDVILANILPGILTQMASDAVSCMADGGIIILSGILEDQQESVITAYEALGVALMDNLVHHGWASLVMVKSS